MLFDRDGQNSPQQKVERDLFAEKESGVVDRRQLLSESVYRVTNEDQLAHLRGIQSGIVNLSNNTQQTFVEDGESKFFDPLIDSLTNFTYKVRVSNFRDGIVSPIIDYLTNINRDLRDVETRRHKENTLYYAEIRNAVERSGMYSRNIGSSIRETYYGLTKSILSSLYTIFSPIFKGVTGLLFGFGSKEKSVVQAVEEQTQFLRTGFIVNHTSMLTRFFRRGIVGSLGAGLAGIVGVGRGASQSAERGRSEGRELNVGEKIAETLRKRLGLFGDITKMDLRKNEEGPETQQLGMLNRIRLGVEAIHEHLRMHSKVFFAQSSEERDSLTYNLMSMFEHIINLENTTKIGFNAVIHSLQSGFKSSNDLLAGMLDAQLRIQPQGKQESSVLVQVQRNVNDAISASLRKSDEKADGRQRVDRTIERRKEREESQNHFENKSILDQIHVELERANSAVPSIYEQKMIHYTSSQYEELKLANEMALDEAERKKREKEPNSAGGIIGLAIKLGALLFTGKAAMVVKRAAMKYIITPLVGTMATLGLGLLSLGKKYIISPIIGAVKAAGLWLLKNGVRVLLLGPFAKIFAGAVITKLFYDHLLRPIIGWFDDTFGFEIGARLDTATGWVSTKFSNLFESIKEKLGSGLDSFTDWFSGKFLGMVDWIKDGLAKVPLIGRLFKGDSDSEENIKRVEPSGDGFGSRVMDRARGMYSDGLEQLMGLGDRGRSILGDASENLSGYAKEVFVTARETSSNILGSISESLKDVTDRITKDMSIRGGIDNIRENVSPYLDSAQERFMDFISPVMEKEVRLSEDIASASEATRTLIDEQLEHVKKQRQEMKEQQNIMIEVLEHISFATSQTAMSSGLNFNYLKNNNRDYKIMGIGGND